MPDYLSLIFSSILAGNAAVSVNLEKNLGHPNYHVRAATTRYFSQNSDLYLARVQKALENDDQEVVMRARCILNCHHTKVAKKIAKIIESDYKKLPFIAGLQLINAPITLPSGRKFVGGSEMVYYLCECHGVGVWDCNDLNYEKATSQFIGEMAYGGYSEKDIHYVLKRIEFHNKTAYTWLQRKSP